ncbi:hypothetical protein V6N13_126176 [Hibiscus sabdariffa]
MTLENDNSGSNTNANSIGNTESGPNGSTLFIDVGILEEEIYETEADSYESDWFGGELISSADEDEEILSIKSTVEGCEKEDQKQNCVCRGLGTTYDGSYETNSDGDVIAKKVGRPSQVLISRPHIRSRSAASQPSSHPTTVSAPTPPSTFSQPVGNVIVPPKARIPKMNIKRSLPTLTLWRY